MDHKAEAQELFYSFYRIERKGNTLDAKVIAKQCALTAICKMIEYIKVIKLRGIGGYRNDEDLLLIKQEIEKL